MSYGEPDKEYKNTTEYGRISIRDHWSDDSISLKDLIEKLQEIYEKHPEAMVTGDGSDYGCSISVHTTTVIQNPNYEQEKKAYDARKAKEKLIQDLTEQEPKFEDFQTTISKVTSKNGKELLEMRFMLPEDHYYAKCSGRGPDLASAKGNLKVALNDAVRQLIKNRLKEMENEKA